MSDVMAPTTQRRPAAAILLLCGFSALWLGGVWPASAQVSNLDKGKFIDALQREGMTDLLLHLLENEPPDDPVETQLIRIAQLQIRYRDENQQLSREESLEAWNDLLVAYQGLIQSNYEHEQRPIWQTDLAELILFSYLQGTHLNALDFYDLGVPTLEQRQAVEAMIPVAWVNLADAEQGLFDRSNRLPREPDHQKRINSGLWARMMEEYYNIRTPLFGGQGAYFASLLPDASPYYQNLGDQRVPFQARTAADEKKRLRELAISKLKPMVDDAADRRGVRLLALAFTGRAQTLAGQYDAAIKSLDEVISAGRNDLTHLQASLTRGRAMAGAGQPLQALDHLTRVEFHPLAQQSLYMRLLVVDQQHQILLKTNPDQAYAPYLALLADKDLPEDRREALKRQLIYPRWASAIADDADLTRQPAVVLAAIGELARLEAQDLFAQAAQAQQAGDETRTQELLADSARKSDRAIRILEALLKREDLDPPTQAKALYNLGYARYFKDSGNPQVLLAAARLWTETAEKMPDFPEAAEALGNAESALAALYAAPNRLPGVGEAYERAASLLIERYPASLPAHNARLRYGFYVLLPAGEYEKAAEVFGQIPSNHETYWEARREYVLALQKVYEQAPPDRKFQALRAAMDAAQFVMEETERELIAASGTMQMTLEDVRGHAILTMFDLLVADGKSSEALKLVENFEQKFGEYPTLVQGLLQRKIIVLAENNRFDQLEQQARDMMLRFPNEAAPVINGVLDRLDSQIDALRQEADTKLVQAEAQALRDQATQRATAASTLAQLLFDWAKNQRLGDAEMLPYQLILVKALRLSNQTDQALQVIRPLAIGEFQNDATVVTEYAETLFAAGLQNGQVINEGHLISAAEQYKVLINGFAMGPFPPQFWNAWMRWMQIADALGQGTAGIPARVRELELFDRNLGGEPYRSEMRRLATKYAAAGR